MRPSDSISKSEGEHPVDKGGKSPAEGLDIYRTDYSARNASNISAGWQSDSARLVEKTCLPRLELTEPSGDSGMSSQTVKAYEALRGAFYVSGNLLRSPKLYANDSHSKGTASAWDMGEVIEADLATRKLSPGSSKGLDQDLKVLERFWDGRSKPPAYDSGYGPSGDKYYDDNSWIGIAFVDAYKQTSNPAQLERAKQVFKFQELGEQGTDKLAHPGGVFWTQQKDNLYRATVSTAGAAQLALELYQQTHDKEYLDFATRQYDWVNNNLRSPGGMYYDGIDKDGTLHKEEYTYNQGLMLGNATLLYQSTGDPKYLQQAKVMARTALQVFSGQGDNPENAQPLAKQLPFFNAVFFKNLMMLDKIAPDPSYRQALADYSSTLKQMIDPEKGLIKREGEHTLLDQSSAVQIFALANENPVLRKP